MTTRQLALVEPATRPVAWRLDDHTREIGLRGVAEGRRILREAAAREAANRDRERSSAA
jgi:hypothetical protein